MGGDGHYDYYAGNWDYQEGEQQLGYFGNVIMILEKGESGGRAKQNKTNGGDTKETTCVTGEHDPAPNATTAKPIALCNRYQLLHDDDSDSQIDGETCDDNEHTDTEHDQLHNNRQRHRLNKGQ